MAEPSARSSSTLGKPVTVLPLTSGSPSDSVANAIYIYENMGSRSGPVAPDRTVSGASTLLSSPTHLQLLAR